MMKLQVLIAALALTSGCKAKAKDAGVGSAAPTANETMTAEPKVADPKVADPKAAPVAAVVTGKCADGFTLQATGGFCIKLPAGVKGDGGPPMEVGNNKAQQFGWAGGEKGSDFGITVKVWPMSEYYADSLKDVSKAPYQGKALAQGKIGDTGAWGTGESAPSTPPAVNRHELNAVNKNDKMQLSCNITRAIGTGAPTEDDVFEACKTITFPK